MPVGRRILCFLAVGLLWWAHVSARGGEEPADVRRLVVVVPPADTGSRTHDEQPAEIRLDAAQFQPGSRIDLATLLVVPCNAAGPEIIGPPRPIRWYDDTVPYEFPEFEGYINQTDGLNLPHTKYARWGDFYTLGGDGASGRLTWLHRQEADRQSHYLVNFRLMTRDQSPWSLPPRGFVGDGSHRCAKQGPGGTGMIHSRLTLGDWNADGLTDGLVGGSRGGVLFYPNLGTIHQPRFEIARLLSTADAVPLDVGWSAAPLVVDWNNDGPLDRLCGAEKNRVVYFRNEGTASDPRLRPEGFVKADGEPLEVPATPVPKSPPGIYNVDYYPVLDAVDFTGDGRRDLLVGGFVTGRIFLFANVGVEQDGTPRLEFRGPIETQGEPLNVGDWAAAPCCADFDGDGDLDLTSGSLPLTAGGGDSSNGEHFLRYWENTGSIGQPCGRPGRRWQARSFVRDPLGARVSAPQFGRAASIVR